VTAGLAPAPAAGAASRLVIAVIGDYGYCAYRCSNEQAVADLVHSWHPDAVATVGDNSYENALAAEIQGDQRPYAADVQAGHFYQVTGNHDWANTCDASALEPSTAYFGRPSHYVAHLGGGLLDFFATDMNCGDPDGDSANSRQAAQYRADVAASTAIWKVTASHQAFYSSGQWGSKQYTHWAILPALDLFLSGHDHDWEHLVEDGQTFVVDGVGGKNLRPVCVLGCIGGSVWHDDQHFGAVRLTVTPTTLVVEFITVGGQMAHAFTLTKSAVGSPAPSPSVPGPLPSIPDVGAELVLPIRAAFYSADFPEAWSQLSSYHPSLGRYDSGNRSVIADHIRAMRYGNIQAAIVSWPGPGTPPDSRVPRLLDAADGLSFRWALAYEPATRTEPTVAQMQADLAYLWREYASRHAYLRLDGRFVVFLRGRTADGCAAVPRWKQAAGAEAYLVMKVFVGFRTCPVQPDGWYQLAPAVDQVEEPGFSFSVSPGFTRPGDAQALARDLRRWNRDIQAMTESDAPFQLVTTFNGWGDGTAVEAAQEWASASGNGLYLDALHNNGLEHGQPAGAAPFPIPPVLAGVVALGLVAFGLARRRRRMAPVDAKTSPRPPR
jgi:hypothetical protein